MLFPRLTKNMGILVILSCVMTGCISPKAYIKHGEKMFQRGMDTQKLINLNLELQNVVLKYVVEMYEEREERKERTIRSYEEKETQ